MLNETFFLNLGLFVIGVEGPVLLSYIQHSIFICRHVSSENNVVNFTKVHQQVILKLNPFLAVNVSPFVFLQNDSSRDECSGGSRQVCGGEGGGGGGES